jgi:hypothetical protein
VCREKGAQSLDAHATEWNMTSCWETHKSLRTQKPNLRVRRPSQKGGVITKRTVKEECVGTSWEASQKRERSRDRREVNKRMGKVCTV